MGLFFKDPVEAELKKLQKQEDKFLYKRMEKKESYINQLLAEKVPDSRQNWKMSLKLKNSQQIYIRTESL